MITDSNQTHAQGDLDPLDFDTFYGRFIQNHLQIDPHLTYEPENAQRMVRAARVKRKD